MVSAAQAGLAAVGWTLIGASVLGTAYWLVAGRLARATLAKPKPTGGGSPGVSIIKPLHGAHARLSQTLQAYCEQDYTGPVQIVFGVQDEADPAIAVVRQMQAANPNLDIDLVIDGRSHGANRKTSNLVNILAATRHPVLILSDADIVVGPDYARTVVAALAASEVGLVSCFYLGESRAGLWSKLSAMGISYRFTPSAILAKAARLAEPCFGATIALTAETLDRIGGLAPLADHLADDYEIGRAVRDLGMKIALPPLAVTHLCDEASATVFFDRELRSGRTVRHIDPWGYAGSVVTYPLPLALVGLALIGPSPFALAAIAGALVARFTLKTCIDAATGVRAGSWWLLPVSDLLSFGLFVASFMVNSVGWHGIRFRVSRQGALVQS